MRAAEGRGDCDGSEGGSNSRRGGREKSVVMKEHLNVAIFE